MAEGSEPVSARPLTDDERRVLEGFAALPGGLADTAKLAATAFVLSAGVLWLFGRWIDVLARIAIPVGAGSAAYVAFLVRRLRARTVAARAASGDPHAEDLGRGEAEVARYEVADAIRVEAVEDEGIGWFLRLRGTDRRVLFLAGQDLEALEAAGAFPATTVEVSRAPRARTVLDVKAEGPPVPPSTFLAPFPRQGGLPASGDLLDLDFESIRRGEAYGNAPGRRAV